MYIFPRVVSLSPTVVDLNFVCVSPEEGKACIASLM